ncbi:hypothetical protein J7I88_12085, partial [Paraburkholderia strydomiana]|nr:hypothetical protein [Paraburkholderia strydomiana]
SINTTDNGTINISGNSTDGTGVVVDPNGSINISGNGSGEISGNSTNGNGTIIDGNVNVTDNGTVVIIDNGTILTPGDNGGTNGGDSGGNNGGDNGGNSGGNNGGDNGGNTPPVDNGGNTPPVDNGGTASAGGSSGGSGGIAAGAIGAIGIGGAAAYFMSDMLSAHWYLESEQALTLESGDPVFWADAELEHVTVDMTTNSADVQLFTHAGALDRHLAYRDGAEGVKHFTYEDPQQKTKADLSVNMQTHEYFYTESGVKDGKAYVVKSHGWLKMALAPTGSPARATIKGAA